MIIYQVFHIKDLGEILAHFDFTDRFIFYQEYEMAQVLYSGQYRLC